MSNDALFPIPPVAEADPALVTAEPAAPIDPADAVSDAAAETTEHNETDAETMTTTDELPGTYNQADSTPAHTGADEIAALSPEGEIAIEELPDVPEATHDTAAPAKSGGIDPALISARMAEIVTEFEAIAATPDMDDAGKHPDDRALTERLRGLEETWRTLISSGVQEPELRARQAAARAEYAGSRSRRAEMRAVDRARAGETKRALLVEAFALAQLAQGTSLSQLAGRRVGDEAGTKPSRPAPAARAAEPVTPDAVIPDTVTSDSVAPDTVTSESVAPDAITDNVVAVDATAADTGLTPPAEAAEDAAIAPVDATLADGTIADVADREVAADIPQEIVAEASQETADPATLIEDPAEIAVVDGPTEPAVESVPAPEPATAPVTTSTITIDITAIARRARELQAEWTAAGFAGREVENELQPLFRRYMQVVFDLSRKESSGKSDARRALVSAARALADQAGEDVTNDAISRLVRDAKNLQTQWKDGEAAPPAVESGAWRQFSGALRQVFAARERLSAGAKTEREAIIASVTALASAKEPMRAMRDLGPLLRRWRESGPVTTPVYEALKVQLDRAAATVRERADAERKRRDAEDEKSQGERAKNASKILREAERSGRGKRPERPAAQAQAQGALAAALAEAFGRAERVAEDVRSLERTVVDVRSRLQLAESGSLESTTEEVENEQGFTVRRQTIDPGAVNPARLRAELAQAEQALGRRQAELQELTSNARGFGLSG